MKRNVLKVFVLALVTIICLSICIAVNAEGTTTGTSLNQISVGFITSTATDSTGAATSVNRMIGAVLTVVQVIGVGVAVIMLVVLAIKYIAASPGDKAEIKKHAVVYVVGAVVLFAASGILGIIRNFASNISAENL